MRYSIQIGSRIFKSKKEALTRYKTILNSYDFGEELNPTDFGELLALIDTHPRAKEKIGVGIQTFRVVKGAYKTKCFEFVRADNSTEYFSYTLRINGPKTDFTKFREACRQAVQEDLINVKQAFFKRYAINGQVKCQETKELLKYEGLNIDHRQPNTFSVIADRFIEIHRLNIGDIEYLEVEGGPNELADNDLREKFRQYHKEKANLRLVAKNVNLGRSYQAQILRQEKDLVIE